jgi:hypothetical protein
MLAEVRSDIYTFIDDKANNTTMSQRIQSIDEAGIIAEDGIYAALQSASHEELCRTLSQILSEARRPKRRCCFFSNRR